MKNTLILNVDDNEAGRYAKSRMLRAAGYTVVEASTGQGAIDGVAEHRPALVLLDVRLPDIGGHEVCARIKRDAPDVLVLQVSATFVTERDRVRGIDSGADAYLSQPLAADELVSAVRALFRVRLAEKQLRTVEERSRLVLESATDYAIITSGPDGTVTSWNVGAERLFGWTAEEAAGQSAGVIFTPEDREAGAPEQEMVQASKGDRAEDERWHMRRDGSRFWGAGLLFPLGPGGADGFLKILRDRTSQREQELALKDLNLLLEERVAERTRQLESEILERRQAEQALQQSQKMEAVGQLTGGIAHDFNNLLTAIIGSLDLLRRRAALPADLDRYLDAALQSSRRAASLTQRLLAFSRRQALLPRSIDVNDLILGMDDLIRRSLGENVRLQAELAEGPLSVWCDPHQLENALLNLVINARDAMADGGSLVIATARRSGTQSHPGITVSVTDTGSGMSDDIIAHVFDPFFTTKPIGQGTGLGLSQVYGFAKQSGGDVEIESRVGDGTRITIVLPVGPAEADILAVPAPAPSTTEAALGNARILVVEDEALVRMLVVQTLEDAGFDVLEAVDADSALKTLGAGEAIDLLVTDVGLPGMNGRQLVDIVRAERPMLCVLFMTGYAHNAEFGGLADPRVGLIAKPFDPDDLVEACRRVLAAR